MENESDFSISIGGKNKLNITDFKLEKSVTFLDYIMGGCEVNVQVAVDFGKTNGKKDAPHSLHYLNPEEETPVNQYTEAINSVVSILQNYDLDKEFPVYGFGGIPPNAPEQRTSHCFALNGDTFAPEVYGLK